MSQELPAPLVPPEVDLRDFQFMPLYGARLLDSETWLLCDADEKVAALALWWKSWHQTPAASLPDNDRLLASLAGYGVAVKAWLAVKTNSMRGWKKCADGRLYHPIVADIALDSWHGKQMQAWKQECDRIRKENKRRAEAGEPALPFPSRPERLSIVVPSEIISYSVGKMGDDPPETPARSDGIPSDFQTRDREGTGISPTDLRPPERAPKRATRLPGDFVVPHEWRGDGAAARERNSLPAINLNLEAEKFTNYWLSKPGQKGAHLDWHKTWINWCLNAKGAAHERQPQRQSPVTNLYAGMAAALAERESAPDRRADFDATEPLLDGERASGAAPPANGRLAR